MRRRMRLLLCVLLIILAAYLAYVVSLGVVPYARQPEVSDAFAAEVDIASFYGEAPCADRVMLVEDNVAALDCRIAMIANAREEIILSTFDFHADESGTDIAAMLYEAAERGVRVRILVDGAMAQAHMAGEEIFDALASHENVEIRVYNPIHLLKPWTINGRLHDKYLIVDQTAYLLGGRNTYDYFLGDYPVSHPSCDREVLVYNTGEEEAREDSSLYAVRSYFEAIWTGEHVVSFREDASLAERPKVQSAIAMLAGRYQYLYAAGPERFEAPDYLQVTYPANAVSLIANPTGIGVKEPWVLYTLTQLMGAAKERVVIHSPYAVCNDVMYQALADTARKVENVSLMVNSVENGDNLCASSDYLRHRADVWATGVDLYEYDGGASYHGKTILIDDRLSVVGSWNLDMRSAYLDTELMLAIDCRELNQELDGVMQQFQAESRLVTGPDSYQLPEGLQIQQMSFGKTALLTLLRLVSGPIRFLL